MCPRIGRAHDQAPSLLDAAGRPGAHVLPYQEHGTDTGFCRYHVTDSDSIETQETTGYAVQHVLHQSHHREALRDLRQYQVLPGQGQSLRSNHHSLSFHSSRRRMPIHRRASDWFRSRRRTIRRTSAGSALAGRCRLGVSNRSQHLLQQLVTRSRSSARHGRLFRQRRVGVRVPYQFVEAHGCGLSEIHRRVPQTWSGVHGDGHEPVAVAHGIVAEAGLFRSKEQGYAVRLQSGAHGCAASARVYRCVPAFVSHCGGAHHQVAVSDSIGNG
jgi:hypothetical protein